MLLVCTQPQVFKAYDPFVKDYVALKRIKPEHEREGAHAGLPPAASAACPQGVLNRTPSLALFPPGFPITALREVKILRHLNHVNIVNLMGIVSDKDRPEQHVIELDKRDFYMVRPGRARAVVAAFDSLFCRHSSSCACRPRPLQRNALHSGPFIRCLSLWTTTLPAC